MLGEVGVYAQGRGREGDGPTVYLTKLEALSTWKEKTKAVL